jgi:hypothetical protein
MNFTIILNLESRPDIVVGYQLTESKNLRRFNHQLEQVYPSQNYPPDIFEQE